MGSQDTHREVHVPVIKPTPAEAWVHKLIRLMDELDGMDLPNQDRREIVMIAAASRTLNTKVNALEIARARRHYSAMAEG